MTEEKKSEILLGVRDLIKEHGCYSDVMSVANYAFTHYKENLDEQVGIFEYLVEEVVSKEKAKEWIENEKTKALEQFGMPATQLLSTTSRDPEKYGTFPHEEWMATSIGVVETLVTALGNKELMEKYDCFNCATTTPIGHSLRS